ncbi:MAG: AIM24 family protein [Candidatus Dormibacteraceae bacterium]
MPLPVQLPTIHHDGQGPNLLYHVEGELVPVLRLQLGGSIPAYFEHHVLLWKEPSVDITLKPIRGAFKRFIAGMPIFMTQAVGQGQIAFSRDGTGQIIPMHLQPGQSIEVREHQFLAASDNVAYTFTRVRGIANMLFGSTGFFIDRFTAEKFEGVVFLHGYGNVFEVMLGPGEAIDVEPGGWLYKDLSVKMDIKVMGLRSGLFAGSGQLVFNRFTGPGRLGLQSMYVHLGDSGTGGAAGVGGAVGLAGAVLKGLSG